MIHPAIQLFDVRRKLSELAITEKELESQVMEIMGDSTEIVVATGQSVAGYASNVLLVCRTKDTCTPNLVEIKKFPLVRGEG